MLTRKAATSVTVWKSRCLAFFFINLFLYFSIVSSTKSLNLTKLNQHSLKSNNITTLIPIELNGNKNSTDLIKTDKSLIINTTKLENVNKINISQSPLKLKKPKFKDITSNSPSSIKNENFLEKIEIFLMNFMEKVLVKKSLEIFPGLNIKLAQNKRKLQNYSNYTIPVNHNLDRQFKNEKYKILPAKNNEKFNDGIHINLNIPRALETGRLFFFKGIKKILWPLFIGVQIAKSILLALFLPSLLGSLGKIVGKGISTISGFHHPSEGVDDLDFKDNTYNFDQESNYGDYMYGQSDVANSLATQMYNPPEYEKNGALSRFGFGDNKITENYSMKNTKMNNINAKNNFKVFHDIPASSMLLTNYDPFYSPLLSRLDSVFQQFGLTSVEESCREKLVCLMYANPAKYAPYSNLVSAQLSRELNELRKPASDSQKILRFFKYMKAAKDGQDGVMCETAFSDCKNFKDSENPAMINTFNDINKLVQARKLTAK